MTSKEAESRGGVPRGWNGGLASPSMEEHFYPFLMERRHSYRGEDEEEQVDEDLNLALERKEKDLLLAAELGKALLERNDYLERTREALEEELREAHEIMEQERHNLRLKMEVRESEFRGQIADLESDLNEARQQIRLLLSEHRECGRETATAAQELSEQNQRLLEQLAQASRLEQSLTAEMESLKEENRELILNRGQFAPCLQSLQSENSLLLEKKRELESQTRQLREEYENAQNMMYNQKETVLQLERHKSGNETKMHQMQLESQDLRDSQRRLQAQVKELQEELHMRDSHNSMQHSHFSLHSEIRQSTAHLDQEVTLQYLELTSLREELQRLRDLSQDGDLDSVLKQAVRDRDEAIMKKGELELELVKCHLEKDSLSRQLLSAVQQKVSLSQELEAWQDDMQVIISQQLKSQKEEKTTPASPIRKDSTRRPRDAGGGIFSFFKKI
ncbi:BICD family-like cargo adapter 2 isoform X2 [Bombina bombina]|uniref:BICD family-like cargo adapter 2 isoform X2 n=1 Tax=Bombina bombina TaxID=8345 RepID=UPI00235AB693|nr:BICD family-like cargo adapter 2 isoform X2 [Bombina bombina]